MKKLLIITLLSSFSFFSYSSQECIDLSGEYILKDCTKDGGYLYDYFPVPKSNGLAQTGLSSGSTTVNLKQDGCKRLTIEQRYSAFNFDLGQEIKTLDIPYQGFLTRFKASINKKRFLAQLRVREIGNFKSRIARDTMKIAQSSSGDLHVSLRSLIPGWYLGAQKHRYYCRFEKTL